MEEIINAFPGYEYIPAGVIDKSRHNMYRGVDLGFGGYSYSEPGIYSNIALIDIQSMHPSSMVAMNYFGKYTQRFKDILDTRIAIKTGNFEKAREMFDGALKKYLEDETYADALAQALKIAINSAYGQTAASFKNPMRDERNVNNIVALRGALFMKTLLDELQSMGWKVIHLKVDSMKIPNATPEIIQFCMNFAKKYGYNFEHEATYERICLLDKSQYVATYMSIDECEKRYGYVPSDNRKHFKKHDHPWTTTGDAFQHPYVFKTLFSGEPIEFEDRCEFKQVKTSIYIDSNPEADDCKAELEKRAYNADPSHKRKKVLSKELSGYSDTDLEGIISRGHELQFIGRVGNFFPIRPGSGGGALVRKKNGGGYDSVNGTKGYFWMEAEKVKALRKEDEYDPRYFKDLIDKAIENVTELNGVYDPSRFDRFIDLSRPYEELPQGKSKEEVEEEAAVEPDRVPRSPTLSAAAIDVPWIVPCGDSKYNTCMECRHCHEDVCDKGYSLATFDDELPF